MSAVKYRYHLVEFEDGLQVVPENWIKKITDECLYPNYKKDQEINKAIKNQQTPQDDWLLYPIIRLFGIYESYSDACNKLKKAEMNSDVNTDIDDKAQRKTRAKKKTYTDKSSDTSDYKDYQSRLAPLPKAPVVHMNTKDVQNGNKCSYARPSQEDEYSDTRRIHAQKGNEYSDTRYSQKEYEYSDTRYSQKEYDYSDTRRIHAQKGNKYSGTRHSEKDEYSDAKRIHAQKGNEYSDTRHSEKDGYSDTRRIHAQKGNEYSDTRHSEKDGYSDARRIHAQKGNEYPDTRIMHAQKGNKYSLDTRHLQEEDEHMTIRNSLQRTVLKDRCQTL
ncbi:uncharacterized protein LOC143903504 isoform X2 [Temnothorax americanus]